MWIRNALTTLAAVAATLFPLSAFAEGRAVEWQIGLQRAATPTMEQINSFHNLLLYIIIAISVFVLVLLLWVMFRYRESANPTPSKTTHNTMVEVVWTVVPIMILVLIAVPSFKLLYFSDRAPKGEEVAITVKAIGSRFQWTYEYQIDKAGNGFKFDSALVCREASECAEAAKVKGADGKERAPLRLLDVDNRLVVPVNAVVRLQTTAADVIHSWAVPAFGVKLDAVPGRLNETWFKALRTGVYYGMCSELCGGSHAYMPIAVEVLSKEDFAAWVEKSRKNDDYEQIEGKPQKASVTPSKTKPTETKQTQTKKIAAASAPAK